MFVRGMTKIDILKSITKNTLETPIGIVTLEMKTKDDRLSVWHIDNIGHINYAFLSIILTRNDIFSDCGFVVFEDNDIANQSIDCKPSDPGCDIPLVESKASHYDMCNIRVCNLVNVLDTYKNALDREKAREDQGDKDDTGFYVRYYDNYQVEEMIKRECLNGNLKEDFQKRPAFHKKMRMWGICV